VTRRPDPFMMALESLKSRAEGGVYVPGAPIVIVEEATRLRLSTTPVREALAWLCGYGLIDRAPAGGYLMRRLDPALVRDQIAFRLQCLKIGLNGAGQVPGLRSGRGPDERPERALRDHMLRAVRGTGNAAVVDAYLRVRSQLEPVTVAEAQLFDDLSKEAATIVALFEAPPGSGLPEALQAYHQRRMDAAALLVMEAGASRTATGGPMT